MNFGHLVKSTAAAIFGKRLFMEPLTPLRRATLRWGVAMGLLGAVMCFIPLVNVLGYQAALLLSIPAWLLGAHLGASANHHPSPWSAWSAATLASIAATSIPLILLMLNALRIRNCDPGTGLIFYLLIPWSAAVISTGAGVAGSTLLGKRKLATSLVVLLGVAGSLLAGFRLYLHPQVNVFGAPFGFLSVVLYDEELSIPAALLWVRLYQMGLAGAAVAAAAIVQSLRRQTPATGGGTTEEPSPGKGRIGSGSVLLFTALLAASAILHSHGATLGFRQRTEEVRTKLGATKVTANFTIRHSRDIPTREMEIIADDLEYQLHQTSSYFDIPAAPPPQCETIEAFIYSSVDQRRTLVGLGGTSMARPWSCQLHLVRPRSGSRIISHEIAHITTAAFAEPPLHMPARFGILPVMGLVEGAAEAATVGWDMMDLHQRAAALRSVGRLPALTKVMDAHTFWSAPAGAAYTAAGSFVRWLVEQEGAEKFRRVYRTGRVEDVYGSPLYRLNGEWEAFLDEVEVDQMAIREATARYGRPAIFDRECAHERANVLLEARRALGRGRPTDAVSHFQVLVDLVPGFPTYHLGLAESLAACDRIGEASGQAYSVLEMEDENGFRTRARALRLLGDLAWRRGSIQEAAAYFAQSKEMTFSGPFRRELQWRLSSLGLGDGEETLRALLTGEEGDRDVALLRLAGLATRRPHMGLPDYLLGRHLLLRNRPELAIDHLERARQAGVGHAVLEEDNLRLLAMAMYHEGRPAEARVIFQETARNTESLGTRRAALDWVNRCDWKMGDRKKKAQSQE